MNRDKLRQVLVIFFAVGQWVSAGLTNGGFEGSSAQGQGLAPNYFLPAGYTFSIWFVIMVLSVVYVVYQLQEAQKTRELHRRIGWPVLLNTILFSVWLAVAIQPGPAWLLGTVLVITLMLACNIAIFIELRRLAPALTPADRWLAVVPASIYFAWLMVATIANVTSYLYGIGVTAGDFGPIIGAGLLATAVGITAWVLSLYNIPAGAYAFGLTVAWAAVGIAVQNLAQSPLVTAVAALAALITLLLTVFMAPRGSTPPPVTGQADAPRRSPSPETA